MKAWLFGLCVASLSFVAWAADEGTNFKHVASGLQADVPSTAFVPARYYDVMATLRPMKLGSIPMATLPTFAVDLMLKVPGRWAPSN